MFLTLLTLLLLLLTAAANDAYTACACVRKRINNRPCFDFVRDAVPRCAPTANWASCEQLCCQSCHLHGDDWPVCRSAALRRVCDKYSPEQSPEDTHSDIGPKMADIPKMMHPDSFENDLYPSPGYELYSSEEPYYTELLPTPGEGEGFEPSPVEQLEPTPLSYPDITPEVTASIDPPFDATNEGELDLAPARGRPFAPAACECMGLGTACYPILAAASGVCRPGVHASKQGLDCHFACCRICIVNIFATYCDDPPVIEACGL